MSASPSVLPDTPPKKSRTYRKSTRKPSAVQTAIITKRLQGKSKNQIAQELKVSRNTVKSIVELTNVDQQIEQYRRDTIAIVPDAIISLHNQIKSGDGDLSLRLIERAGVIGDNAIEAMRRQGGRERSAINVLVQAGATVTIPQPVAVDSGNHNVSLSDAHTTNRLSTGTVERDDDASEPAPGTPSGKHPKDGVGR